MCFICNIRKGKICHFDAIQYYVISTVRENTKRTCVQQSQTHEWASTYVSDLSGTSHRQQSQTLGYKV